MAFTQFTKDMDIIGKLSDTPNVDDGLTAAQLKEKFDEGGKAVKNFINSTLLPEISQQLAEKPTESGIQKAVGGKLVAATPGEDYVTGLLFQNISVDASAFASNNTYADYPFRAAVPLSGVTAALVPYVAFGLADVVDGNLAPVVESYDGGIYLYAEEKPSAALMVPTILFWRVSA